MILDHRGLSGVGCVGDETERRSMAGVLRVSEVESMGKHVEGEYSRKGDGKGRRRREREK